MEVKIKKEDNVGVFAGILAALIMLFAIYGSVSATLDALGWWQGKEYLGWIEIVEPDRLHSFEFEIPLPDPEDLIESLDQPDLDSIT